MQKKGKFGLLLSFYAILAFVFVILEMPVLCAGLLVLVLLAEKDEWASRQVLQAFFLSLATSFLTGIFGQISNMMPELSFIGSFLHVAFAFVEGLIYLAAIVFSILGILRVMREQEADIPIFADFAYRAYGKTRPRRAPSPMPNQQYQQPTYGGPQQPQQGQPPYAPPYQQPYGAPQQQPPFTSQPPQNGTDQQRPLS